MEEKSNLDYDFADIVTWRPHEFTVGRKHLRLYPVTLAKTLKLGRMLEGMNIDKKMLELNPYLEALRLVETDKEACCSLLALHTTPNTYRDLYNLQGIAQRRNLLMDLDDRSVAKLLIYVLSSDKTDALIRHCGMDKERMRLLDVMKLKDASKNNLSFGGLTVLGSFVAPLKEMGYSDSEILFECSYSYLRLMLADKPTSVYVSDNELDSMPRELGGKVLNGDDPESIEQLRTIFAQRGVKIN